MSAVFAVTSADAQNHPATRIGKEPYMIVEGGYAIFGVGCAGGVLTEVLHWWNFRESLKKSAKEAPQLPAYSKNPLYWGITLAMILVGGFVAWIYFGNRAEAIVALHVGLSAPLILQKLTTTVPEAKGAKNIVVTPAPSVRRFFTW